MKFKIFDETKLEYCAEVEFVSDSLEKKKPTITCKVLSMNGQIVFSGSQGNDLKGVFIGEDNNFSLRNDAIWRIVTTSNFRLVAEDADANEYLNNATNKFENIVYTEKGDTVEQLILKSQLAEKLYALPVNPILKAYDPSKKYVVLDTETTGLDRGTDRIIQFALVEIPTVTLEVNKEEIILKSTEGDVNPQRRIPADATRIHGISDDDVKDCPPFTEYIDKILSTIGNSVVVGHNIQFDLDFLNAELIRAGREPIKNECYCTLKASREILPKKGYKGKFSLIDLRNFFKINTGDAHNALVDANATVVLFNLLVKFASGAENSIKKENKTYVYFIVGFVVLILISLLSTSK